MGNLPRPIKIILIVVAVFLSLGLLSQLSFFYTVKYGKAAVVHRFGKLDRVSEPGLHFKIPLAEGVDYFNTQKIIYETNESAVTSKADYQDEPVDTSTEDGQQISVRYTIRFQLDPKKLSDIAQTLGNEAQIVERVVKANSRSVARNVARKYRAQDLYTGKIFEFQTEVQQNLSDSFAKNGLLLDEFLVRQIKFSPEYVEAVEQKQIENEKVKTEEYKADQEKFKKVQLITRAEGEARAQEVLRATLSDQILQKLAIEKWNGILPTYMGSSAVPFLNIRQ